MRSNDQHRCLPRHSFLGWCPAQIIQIWLFLLYLSPARPGLTFVSLWALMLSSAVQVLAASFVSQGGHSWGSAYRNLCFYHMLLVQKNAVHCVCLARRRKNSFSNHWRECILLSKFHLPCCITSLGGLPIHITQPSQARASLLSRYVSQHLAISHLKQDSDFSSVMGSSCVTAGSSCAFLWGSW